MVRPLVIDTDTASDDAVALLMALRAPEVQIEAITVVAGNVALDQAVQNACWVVEQAGAAVAVHAGCERPLLRDLRTATDTHGTDGMGDVGLDLHGRTPAPGHAVEVIAEQARRHAGDLELATLGPLTNVAAALIRRPELASQVAVCTSMIGTGRGPGNASAWAEFNAWVDPEAVRVVLRSGMALRFVGWDVSCRAAVIDPAAAARIRRVDTPAAGWVLEVNTEVERLATTVQGLAGFDLPDPVALAAAIEPESATWERQRIGVVIGDGPQAGRIGPAVDGVEVDVAVDADRDRFLDRLLAAVGAPG